MSSTARGDDVWWPERLQTWYDGWRRRRSPKVTVTVHDGGDPQGTRWYYDWYAGAAAGIRFLSRATDLADSRWNMAPPIADLRWPPGCCMHKAGFETLKRKENVEEARTSRDNKHVVEYGTRYQVVCESFSTDEFVQGAKVVHGRVWDSSVKLVMMVRGEVEEQEEKDHLDDITMLKYNEVEEDRVRIVHIKEVVNEWNFAKAKIDSSNKENLSGQNSNWGESRNSDRTITWAYGDKSILMKKNEGAIVAETSPIDIESEVIKVKLGGRRACDFIGDSKDVESGGEWLPETVRVKDSRSNNRIEKQGKSTIK
ncbi:hypothetical protein PIB30_018515 [Stylosanthes scabra]|uniref:Uncharacterized protein n=1 Tax=Stylosanthes scabra TaxID=79078 RepID=A0ABU6Y4Z5_9FABA|nr:hypothetical protein [Stylosanthes scabra]